MLFPFSIIAAHRDKSLILRLMVDRHAIVLRLGLARMIHEHFCHPRNKRDEIVLYVKQSIKGILRRKERAMHIERGEW